MITCLAYNYLFDSQKRWALYRKIVCADLTLEQNYYWLSSLVVPRPIAWVSTLNENQEVNLAPFSSFNYVAHDPCLVAININRKADGSYKDTARNLRREGEAVIQMGEADYAKALDISAREFDSDHSEVKALGLNTQPSALIRTPRLESGSIQIECKLEQIIPLGSGLNELFILEAVCFHVTEDILQGDRLIHSNYHPLCRVSGPYYAVAGQTFRL